MNLNQITLPVKNMEVACDFYRRMGFNFIELPTDQSYLWREAIIEDPSGNKIKLYRAGENRLNPPWRTEISS